MIVTADDVTRSLRGTAALLNRRADGLRSFDFSEAGFWHSFGAIVLTLPAFVVTLALERRRLGLALPGRSLVDDNGLLALVALAHVAAFLALPVAMIWIVRRLELQRRYVPFVIVTNWISVVGLMVLSVPALLLLLGWAPPNLCGAVRVRLRRRDGPAAMVRHQGDARRPERARGGDRRARARPQPRDRGGAAGLRGLKPSVIDADEIEPRGRRHRPAAGAVARLERSRDLLGGPAPRSGELERADDRAHLVVQEGARRRRDADLVAGPRHIEPVEGADRAVGLAFGGPEGREVVAPDEHRGGLLHRRLVEPPGHLPDAVRIERRRRAAVEDAVEIMPLQRRHAGAEAVGHDLGRQDGDRLGLQMRVRRVADRVGAPLLGEIEMRHLVGRVNAGIGAPGAMNPHRLAGEALDRLLDGLLHRAAVELPLPARKRRAVIFDDELVAGHAQASRSRRRPKPRAAQEFLRRHGAAVPARWTCTQAHRPFAAGDRAGGVEERARLRRCRPAGAARSTLTRSAPRRNRP